MNKRGDFIKWFVTVGSLLVPTSSMIVAADSINDQTKKELPIAKEEVSQQAENIYSDNSFLSSGDQDENNLEFKKENLSLKNNEETKYTTNSYGQIAKYDPIYFPYERTTTFTIRMEYQLEIGGYFRNNYLFISRTNNFYLGYCKFYFKTNYGRKISNFKKETVGHYPNSTISLGPSTNLRMYDIQTFVSTITFTINPMTENWRDDEYINSVYFDLDYFLRGQGGIIASDTYAKVYKYSIDIAADNESYHDTGHKYPGKDLTFSNQLDSSSAKYLFSNMDYWSYEKKYYMKHHIAKAYEILELDGIAMTKSDFEEWKNSSNESYQLSILKQKLTVNGEQIVEEIMNPVSPEPKYLIKDFIFKNTDIEFIMRKNKDNYYWQKIILHIDVL